ncbi:MAG: heme-binding protein [Candidatus Sericytochromatia bacterium]
MKKNYFILFLIFIIITSLSLNSNAKEINLTLEVANKIANKAFECAKTKGIKISVAIVNNEGNLILFNRGENSYVGSIEAAINKAKASNAFKRPTSAFTQAIKNGRIELLSIKEIIAVEGGVPIIIDNNHFGAIGISGGKSVEDEECALKSLEVLY